ncbi:MAG: hypothetical protein C5B50_26120 [Verrucomicrobia bacterium]|nr:MAG: hypothetical protein C5B50_26120 [Verrucomicrobiota bacterium]
MKVPAQYGGDGVEVPLAGASLPHIPDHELLHPVGKGSYGTVWLARNVMGTLRAVKIVFRAQFSDDTPYEREFRGIQKFEPISRSHDGFVDILQIGRNDAEGYFYYVMELADPASVESEARPRSQSFGAASPPSPGFGAVTSAECGSTSGGSGGGQTHPSYTYVPKTLRTEIEALGRLPIETCVAVGVKLASALEYLHRNGLVHRDIKPSNIIFINSQPKLADIGLVTEMSEARSLVGTEGFIPPEGPGTPQADVYSLGKVLYEVSSGKDRRAYPEPPTRLREFQDREQLLELDEVLQKACALDVRERYQSAEAMREELLLLEAGKSVRRLHAVERRLARATRAGFFAALVVAIAVPGFLVALYQRHIALAASRRADTAAQRALTAEGDAKEKLRESYLAESRALRSGHRADKRFAGLELVRKAVEIRPGADARQEAIACLALPGLRFAREWKTTWRDGIDLDLQAEPFWFTQGDPQGTISVRRLDSDEEIAPIPGLGRSIYGLCISPGRRWLSAIYSGENSAHDSMQIWDLANRKRLFSISTNPNTQGFRTVAFSPREPNVAVAQAGGPIILYDLNSKSEIWSHEPRLPTPDGVVFNPSGTRIAVPSRHEPVMEILDALTGETTRLLTNASGAYGAAWHPQGRLLATACADAKVHLWDTDDGTGQGILAGHEGSVMRVEFSKSGKLLASSAWDGGVRLWNVATRREIGSAPVNDAYSIAFSADDRWLGYWGETKMGLFEVAVGQELTPFSYGQEEYNSLFVTTFSPNGRVLAVGYNDGVRLWEAKSGRFLTFLPIPNGRAPVFSPSGDFLLTCSLGSVEKWPLVWEKGETIIKVGAPEHVGEGGSASAHSMDKTGKLLAVIRDGFHVVNLETKEDRALPDCGATLKNGCLSPDARWGAVCAALTNAVFIYDIAAGRLAQTMVGLRVGEVAFSPDSHLLVLCGADEYQFWSVRNWTKLFSLRRPDLQGMWGCVAFARDGRLAAITSGRQVIGLIDSATGEQIASLESSDNPPIGLLTFSPDQTQLAISGYKHPAEVWDLDLIQKELVKMHLEWDLPVIQGAETNGLPGLGLK